MPSRESAPPDSATARQARALALDALAWVAAREDEAQALLAASGADPAALRAMTARPEFAGFMLDFLCETDARLAGFCEAQGLAPEAVARLRARLEAGA